MPCEVEGLILYTLSKCVSLKVYQVIHLFQSKEIISILFVRTGIIYYTAYIGTLDIEGVIGILKQNDG